MREERLWVARRNQQCAEQTAPAPDGSLITCLIKAYMERIDQLRQIRPGVSTYPEACAVVRDFNQAELENPPASRPAGYETFTSPWDATLGTPPPTEFIPHLVPNEDDGDPVHIEIHNSVIESARASFVTVTSSPSCFAVTNYEVWSPDLKQYHGSIADALRRAPTSSDRPWGVSIKGQKLLLNFSDNGNSEEEIDVLGFKSNLAPVLACRVVLEPARPEKLLLAMDKDLCAAVQRGNVENVALDDANPWQLQRSELGKLPSGFESINSAEIYARAVVDIAQNGHPQSIAMLRASIIGGGCAAAEWVWEWPVVITSDGVPDLSSPINQEAIKAGNGVSHLIRYKDRIYVDGHALAREHGTHTVSAISKEGVKRMCVFEPFQYVVRPPETR
jgi:hypothetical protein